MTRLLALLGMGTGCYHLSARISLSPKISILSHTKGMPMCHRFSLACRNCVNVAPIDMYFVDLLDPIGVVRTV